MIRKIIGFIPAAFWLVLTVVLWNGLDPYGPTDVPWNLIVLFILSALSGILLCTPKLIPWGLLIGTLPAIYLLVLFAVESIGIIAVPIAFLTFYAAYAVSYYVYNKELVKK